VLSVLGRSTGLPLFGDLRIQLPGHQNVITARPTEEFEAKYDLPPHRKWPPNKNTKKYAGCGAVSGL